jgi:hypothetical protein
MLPRRRGFVPAVRAVVQAACLAEPAVVRAVVRAIVRAAGRVAAAPDRARHMAVLAEVPGDPVQRGPRVTRAASEAWMERGVR